MISKSEMMCSYRPKFLREREVKAREQEYYNTLIAVQAAQAKEVAAPEEDVESEPASAGRG